MIQEKKKKHDKIVLLAKSKLSNIQVLIARALIDSYISQNEFVSVNNLLKVLREHNDMKKSIKNRKTLIAHQNL